MPVIPSTSGAAYASVAHLRTFGVTTAQADDATVSDAITVASRWVDDATDQIKYGFGNPVVGVTETMYGVRSLVMALPAPVTAITSVTVNGNVTDPAQYALDSPRVLRYLPSYVSWGGYLGWGTIAYSYGTTVAITGTWGWATIPEAVRRATTLYAAGILLGSDLASAEGVTSTQIGNFKESYGSDAENSPEDRALDLLDRYILPVVG